MCWVVRWVVPVVLLQALHLVEGVTPQDNTEGNVKHNARENDSYEQLLHNVQRGNIKPHIVLMVADDLGWYDVSWHNPKVLTPNLENLAVTGVILNQSYVQPSCTPSRSSLLTGRYPFTIGRQSSVILATNPDGLTMNTTILPQELKKLGYSTHIVGKWHLGFCDWKYTPTKRGFDTFYGFYIGAVEYYTHRRGFNRDFDCVSTDPHCGYDFRNNTSPHMDVEGTYSTHLYSSYVEDLLRTRNASDPMFLYMPFQNVHAPLQVPDEYIEPFMHVKNLKRRTKMGMLSAMDEAVGRIVKALKDTGHYNNSIIVFTTDNGANPNDAGNNWPLRGRKHTLWEGGTRGVAFIHSPLLNNKGTVFNHLVHISDWFATLLGVAGGDVPEGLDSIDQWKAISGSVNSARNIMIYNLNDRKGPEGGIRVGDYKLLLGHQSFGKWFPPPEGLPKENLKKLMKNKNIKSLNGQHLSIDQGEQRPFIMDAIPNLWINYTVNGNLSGNSKDRPSPKTFSDLLNWSVEDLVNYKKLTLQLFNIKDDPTEHHDIAGSNPSLVKLLLTRLLLEVPRVVKPEHSSNTKRADPKNWGNIWSPGWC